MVGRGRRRVREKVKYVIACVGAMVSVTVRGRLLMFF